MMNRATHYPPQSGPMEPGVIEIGNANGSSRRLWPEQVEAHQLKERDRWELVNPEYQKYREKFEREQSEIAISRTGQAIRWRVKIIHQTPTSLKFTARRLQAPRVKRTLTATSFESTNWYQTITDFLRYVELENKEEENAHRILRILPAWWECLWHGDSAFSLNGVYEIIKL